MLNYVVPYDSGTKAYIDLEWIRNGEKGPSLEHAIKIKNTWYLIKEEQPVEVQLFLVLSSSINNLFSRGCEQGIFTDKKLAEMNKLPVTLRKIVQKLNEQYNTKLLLDIIDPKTEKDIKKVKEKYNVMTMKCPDIEDKGIKAGEGAIGLAMTYREITEVVKLLKIIRISNNFHCLYLINILYYYAIKDKF